MENHRKNQDSLGEARAMNLAGDLYMERKKFPTRRGLVQKGFGFGKK